MVIVNSHYFEHATTCHNRLASLSQLSMHIISRCHSLPRKTSFSLFVMVIVNFHYCEHAFYHGNYRMKEKKTEKKRGIWKRLPEFPSSLYHYYVVNDTSSASISPLRRGGIARSGQACQDRDRVRESPLNRDRNLEESHRCMRGPHGPGPGSDVFSPSISPSPHDLDGMIAKRM